MQHQLRRNSLGVATHTPTVSPGEVCVFMECFSKAPWPEGMMLMFQGSRSPIPVPPVLVPCRGGGSSPQQHSQSRSAPGAGELWLQWGGSGNTWSTPHPSHTPFSVIPTALTLPGSWPDLPAKECHPLNVSAASCIQ